MTPMKKEDGSELVIAVEPTHTFPATESVPMGLSKDLSANHSAMESIPASSSLLESVPNATPTSASSAFFPLQVRLPAQSGSLSMDPVKTESIPQVDWSAVMQPTYSQPINFLSQSVPPLQPPPSMPFNPQMMAYILHHMGGMVPPPTGVVGMPGAPSGIQVGHHSSMDPQLLPPGEPVFYDPHPQYQPQDPTIYIHQGMVASQDSHVGVVAPPLLPVATSQDVRSPTKTPKRKRKNASVEDYTPSRSNRKRRPTQKLLESTETIQ
jgi:hypothetical protein